MKRDDFSQHRILILGPKTHATAVLRAIFTALGVPQPVMVEETRRAIELLGIENFNAVFYDPAVEGLDGMSFPAAARRSKSVLNPMVPIFALKERARRRDVEAARDVGVTDVLTLPVAPKTVMDKLKSAPRAFIVAQAFMGPDRRAKSRATWDGADRRTHKARKTKVDFKHL